MMEKIQREPLLYIHQPAFKVPEVKMQGSFSARKNKNKPQQENLERQNTKEVREAKDVQQILNQYDEENSKENGRKGLRRVKPFREMNLLERLEYLHNFPKQIPPIPCIFQTEESTIRGVLESKTEDEVVVKQFDRTEKTIPIRDLKAVSMMGLN